MSLYKGNIMIIKDTVLLLKVINKYIYESITKSKL